MVVREYIAQLQRTYKKNMFYFYRLFITALILCSLNLNYAVSEVCRAPRLSGYFDSQIRAESVLPENTKQPEKITIYIEKDREGKFYFQSNFISEGAEHPTKIGDESIVDTRDALTNILWTSKPDERMLALERDAYKNVHWIVDKSVFDDMGRTKLQFYSDNIKLDAVTATNSKEIEPLIQLNTAGSPPPVYLSKAAGCCLYVPASYDAKGLMQELSSIQIPKRNARFISLITDGGTDHAIANSSLHNIAVTKKGGEIASEAELENIFKNASGNTVLLLGHTEGSAYVVRNRRRAEIFRIEIAKLRQMAKNYDVKLIDVGCNTAHEMMAPGGVTASVNVLSKTYDTVQAVKLLDEAYTGSNNFAQLFERFSHPDLQMVLTKDSLEFAQEKVKTPTFTSRLYMKLKPSIQPDVEIASITITLGAAYFSQDDDKKIFVNAPQNVPKTEKEDLTRVLNIMLGVEKREAKPNGR